MSTTEPFCRICRGTDPPLAQPCKCNGSVRFIHQECLKEWLSVSSTSKCEICQFEFQFTPIYADNAPTSIPLYLILSKTIKRVVNTISATIRYAIVSCIWLIVIPLILAHLNAMIFHYEVSPFSSILHGQMLLFLEIVAGFTLFYIISQMREDPPVQQPIHFAPVEEPIEAMEEEEEEEVLLEPRQVDTIAELLGYEGAFIHFAYAAVMTAACGVAFIVIGLYLPFLLGQSFFPSSQTLPHVSLMIGLGYAILASIAVLLLSFTRHSILHQVDYYIKRGFKLVLFLFIEMGLFPWCAGHLINHFVGYSPLFLNTYEWFSGSLFMFHFSLYVDAIRQCTRPGFLYYLRDPNDPEFHPVKDMMEQPLFRQLYKVTCAMVLYAFLILSGGFYMQYLWTKVFVIVPAQLHFMALNDVPLDLFLFHFLLPIVYKIIKPLDQIKRFVHGLLSLLAYVLQLTDFCFHQQGPLQWYTVQLEDSINGNALVPSKNHMRVQKAIFYGTRDMYPELTDSWTLVYLPKWFQLRKYSLYGLFWTTSATTLALFVYISLLLGRTSIQFIMDRPMHDLYALLLGMSYFSLFQISMPKQWVSILICMGCCAICPILLMSTINHYVILPFQHHMEKELVRFYLHEWTVGIVYLRIFYVFVQLHPQWQHLRWPQLPTPSQLWTLIRPLLTVGMALLAIPPLFAELYLTHMHDHPQVIHRLAYPLFGLVIVSTWGIKRGYTALHQYLHRIREEEYMVNRVLQDFHNE